MFRSHYDLVHYFYFHCQCLFCFHFFLYGVPHPRVAPRPPLRPRVPAQQTQHSTPNNIHPETDTQPPEHTIDPNDLIEHILDAIFQNTQESNDDINSSVRSLDDPELTDNLGNNLN